MVKHPKYQAMDDSREINIPIYFEKLFKTYKELILIKIDPPTTNMHVPGPRPRPTYRIKNNMVNKFIAELYPSGKYELFDKVYQQIFDDMIQKIETKAQQALLDYEKEFGN